MIYVLLPAFNEAENLGGLLETLAEEYATWAASTPGGAAPALEAVVVDDGSSDDTAEVARHFQGEIRVQLLEHETNQGLGAALLTGLRSILSRCGSQDVIVSLDADGTHHPRYIFPMVERILAGKSIVVASRFAPGGKEHGVSLIRKLLSRGARLVYRLFYPELPLRDFSCGFRAFRAEALQTTWQEWGDRLFERPGFACTGELMLKTLVHVPASQIEEVPFELQYERKQGVSKMPALQTIRGTIELLIEARGWRKHHE